ATSADTYIVQQGVTKGTAVVGVKHYLGCDDVSVVAMGDSDQDVPMLEAAESWYAPASCSPRVRELGHARGGCVVARPMQRGFLQAAQDLVRKQGVLSHDIPGLRRPASVRTPADLLVTLLHVVERRWGSRLLTAFTWHRL